MKSFRGLTGRNGPLTHIKQIWCKSFLAKITLAEINVWESKRNKVHWDEQYQKVFGMFLPTVKVPSIAVGRIKVRIALSVHNAIAQHERAANRAAKKASA